MKEIEFVKAVASGNDFIIVDRYREQRTESREQVGKLAKKLCQRKLSVGADGLLLIEPSKRADFRMCIFNPDGSEVEMCGNGSRCAALYAHQKRIADKKMVIETRAGDLQAEVRDDKIKIKMMQPRDLRLKLDLQINGKSQNVNYINVGVPHVVLFVPGLESFNVYEAGKAIRYHPEFHPQGTNADFVEVLDNDHIRVRTYERGVEQETLACGTGCVAASIITTYNMQQAPQGTYKVKVDTQGGETLVVYFNVQKDIIDQVLLEGTAKIAFQGKLIV